MQNYMRKTQLSYHNLRFIEERSSGQINRKLWNDLNAITSR